MWRAIRKLLDNISRNVNILKFADTSNDVWRHVAADTHTFPLPTAKSGCAKCVVHVQDKLTRPFETLNK